MTHDETRDELARMDGWNKPGVLYTEEDRGENFPRDMARRSVSRSHWWRVTPNGEFEYRLDDPYPPTLDGANAAVPEGWTWGRFFGVWSSQRVYPSSTLPKDCNTTPMEVIDHGRGHEMDDLYALALACRRAMEERK